MENRRGRLETSRISMRFERERFQNVRKQFGTKTRPKNMKNVVHVLWVKCPKTTCPRTIVRLNRAANVLVHDGLFAKSFTSNPP